MIWKYDYKKYVCHPQTYIENCLNMVSKCTVSVMRLLILNRYIHTQGAKLVVMVHNFGHG